MIYILFEFKISVFDKTEIRLNKSMFKLSDFNFYTSITEKQFIVKNTMTENTVKINSEISALNNIADINDVMFFTYVEFGLHSIKE